ncbi:hypothetical protein [Saccharopolyspora phatthalungensis]|uniref:hypothetical protein n=1 Tax=Saccharopolyspora phatthalungensis TaxID=664693 RepID=UPI001FE9825B|nr:hypothetical protein [Saccharopolyspora phatthalungensis]
MSGRPRGLRPGMSSLLDELATNATFHERLFGGPTGVAATMSLVDLLAYEFAWVVDAAPTTLRFAAGGAVSVFVQWLMDRGRQPAADVVAEVVEAISAVAGPGLHEPTAPDNASPPAWLRPS